MHGYADGSLPSSQARQRHIDPTAEPPACGANRQHYMTTVPTGQRKGGDKDSTHSPYFVYLFRVDLLTPALSHQCITFNLPVLGAL